jgi:hypothetical protein
MENLINKIEARFAAFPKLNPKYIKLIIKYLPLIVGLEMVLLTLRVIASLSPNQYFDFFKLDTQTVLFTNAYLTSISTIIFGFVVLIPSLIGQKKTGWNILFWLLTIRFIIDSLFVFFDFNGSLFDFFSNLILYLSTYYLLFQLRSEYN